MYSEKNLVYKFIGYSMRIPFGISGMITLPINQRSAEADERIG